MTKEQAFAKVKNEIKGFNIKYATENQQKFLFLCEPSDGTVGVCYVECSKKDGHLKDIPFQKVVDPKGKLIWN